MQIEYTVTPMFSEMLIDCIGVYLYNVVEGTVWFLNQFSPEKVLPRL